jgi:hypothetical protein
MASEEATICTGSKGYPDDVGANKMSAAERQQAAAAPLIACTLEPEAVPDRLTAWQTILADADSRTTGADGAIRIAFGGTTQLVELARLVEAEQRCCAFLSFTIVADHRGLTLDVRAPEGAAEVMSALFGSPGH